VVVETTAQAVAAVTSLASRPALGVVVRHSRIDDGEYRRSGAGQSAARALSAIAARPPGAAKSFVVFEF